VCPHCIIIVPCGSNNSRLLPMEFSPENRIAFPLFVLISFNKSRNKTTVKCSLAALN
jgi:hypothetical protein